MDNLLDDYGSSQYGVIKERRFHDAVDRHIHDITNQYDLNLASQSKWHVISCHFESHAI